MKGFKFSELETATDSFSITALVGQGGYGKVYKGILADGTIVAIKRAQQGSLQGENEFYTEIEMLSRLHHRNLVSLVGFCDEEGEQVSHFDDFKFSPFLFFWFIKQLVFSVFADVGI